MDVSGVVPDRLVRARTLCCKLPPLVEYVEREPDRSGVEVAVVALEDVERPGVCVLDRIDESA